jgi:hypothetical protein
MSWNHYPDPGSSQPDAFSSFLDTTTSTPNAEGEAHHIFSFLIADSFLPSAYHKAIQSLQLLTGRSEPASYDTLSTMQHFNLMPGSGVTGMAPELDAGAGYHPQMGDQSYPSTTVHDHTFNERSGITHFRGQCVMH